jgi:hypothetical protein
MTTKLISFLVLLIILAGVYLRRRVRLHMAMMLTAFLIDMAMVVYLELKIHAIDSAAHPFHPFLTFHVIISVLVILIYLHQITSGLLIYFKKISWPWHKVGGITFIIFRIGNLITSLLLDHFRP